MPKPRRTRPAPALPLHPARDPQTERDERDELHDQAHDDDQAQPWTCPRGAPDCPAVPENGARYCARCVSRV